MQEVRNVTQQLKEEPILGPKDWQPVIPNIQEIIRLWRENINYMKTKERRQFPEVLACFHLRVAQAQRQRGNGPSSAEMLRNCVAHFAHCDCPAQEIIQLQVTTEGALFQSTQKFLMDVETGKDTLQQLKDSIIEVQVFPELRKLGIYHRRMSEDYNLLQAHSKAATPLLNLTERPFFIQSPTTARRLEIKAKNFLFLPRGLTTKECPVDNIIESGGPTCYIIEDEGTVLTLLDRLQYGGFCPVNLVRNEGLLLRGNLKTGLIRVQDRLFSFADETARNRFLRAPQSFMEGVSAIAMRLPHLIHILGLDCTSAFSFLAIPKILHMLPTSIQSDFAVQTSVHAIPEHSWDEETLEKRVQELKDKKTDSSQTSVDVSHFHRESVTQVWPPKEKWTQTGVSNGTTMPRYVRVLHNLRGELHQDFKVVKSSYEWP